MIMYPKKTCIESGNLYYSSLCLQFFTVIHIGLYLSRFKTYVNINTLHIIEFYILFCSLLFSQFIMDFVFSHANVSKSTMFFYFIFNIFLVFHYVCGFFFL